MKTRRLSLFIFLIAFIFSNCSIVKADNGLLKSLKKDVPVQKNKRRPINLFKRNSKKINPLKQQVTQKNNKYSKLKLLLSVTGCSLTGVAILVYIFHHF